MLAWMFRHMADKQSYDVEGGLQEKHKKIKSTKKNLKRNKRSNKHTKIP